MITIEACQLEDCAAVASLWNARRLDPSSCWNTADEADEAYVAQLLATGTAVYLAREESLAVGFGLWCPVAGEAWLIALAADDEQVYYTLMDAYCQWGQAAGFSRGFAELGVALTSERARMDALEVIEYTPIGFDPLQPGQPPENRVPRMLRASCQLDVLAAALAAQLGGAA